MRICPTESHATERTTSNDRATFEVRRTSAELIERPLAGDRFVRTAARLEELRAMVGGPGCTPERPSRAACCGTGYAAGAGGGDAAAAQRACLADLARLASAFGQVRRDYHTWQDANPEAREPGNGTRTLGQILDDPTLSTAELSAQLIEVLLHERPETADELRATIPSHELPEQPAAPGGEQPNTEISRGIFSALGMGANLLGGLLQSPLAVPLLTAACTAIPGLQPLAVAIPFIAPIAGMALSGVGGVASQVGQGQAPTADLAGLASPDMLASLVPAITGMLGGAAGPVPGAPLAPLPAS
ncbi:MAG: hypothetical protein A2138_26165 [Deltaproteobacteria bacterium RBG_16_71_12]|nr:MAG: hypothetical protein A2138_26165 [Deltaproteobacteria bacterium RBG_16_71_12]